MQPPIRAPKLTLLGKTFYRTISPAHMSILTDRELIVIREDTRWSDEVKYGGVWDYIPLERIISLSEIEKGNGLLELTIQVPESARLELVFQASARRNIDQFLVQFREMTQVVA